MNCPRCGASTQQGPNGSWLCPNCGWGSGYSPPVRWRVALPVDQGQVNR